MDPRQKDYLVIVQCAIVMERCSGFFCEKAFTDRTGGFAAYPADRTYRTLYLTCGGCCGRGLQRKLIDLRTQLHKREGVGPERIVVQLASCLTRDNFHGPPCPHLDYLRQLIAKLNLDVREDTHISVKAEQRRQAGIYQS